MPITRRQLLTGAGVAAGAAVAAGATIARPEIGKDPEPSLLVDEVVRTTCLVPFAVFASRLRERRGWVVAASALALLGVFFKRINIVMTSMFVPLVGLAPGIPGGRPGQEFLPDPIYLPTWVEWGILIGIASLVGMLITLGVRHLVAPRAARP